MAGLYNKQDPMILRDFMGVLQSFGVLMQNPTELKKQIIEAIQLSEFEQKKVDDAVVYLKQSAEAKSEIVKREASLKEALADIDDKIKDNRNIQEANSTALAKIQKADTLLNDREKKISEREAQQDRERLHLDTQIIDIAKREAVIVERNASITDRENNMRQRAERLQKEIDGIQ